MILLIDNYDSFSYNLYQMIGEIEPDVKVVRNDEISSVSAWDIRQSARPLERKLLMQKSKCTESSLR